MDSQHQIVIVGGGTAGITVAARLLKKDPSLDLAIIEPSTKHYYQPMWTLVGGGMFEKEESERDEEQVIPHGAQWIRDFVESFDPDHNVVITRNGQTIGYDFLVVAAGIQINWNQIQGLKEAVGHNGVCSNYSFETVGSTWKNIQSLKKGTAIFTQPAGAVKCGGAPQKICYLAEDYFRRAGVRDNINVIFTPAGPRIFAVERYAQSLERVVAQKGIDVRFQHNLVEIRAAKKQAIYQQMETGEEIILDYDMLHVTPPMSAPDFISKSSLSDEKGWVDVDKYTLQHTTYENVFGLGDASNLPTSKTGAAIRKQAPVVVENLLACQRAAKATATYDGYTSCPIVTGYHSLILAEFDYSKQPAETFSFDQAEERYSMLMLKKHGLPAMYWHGMLKGRV